MRRFALSGSVLLAAGVTAAAAIWMLTGLGDDGGSGPGNSPSARGTAPAVGSGQPERRAMRVSVRKSQARRVMREVTVSARTEANRSVELRAETDGRVVALGAERGSAVAAGEPVVALDMRERNARLAEAQALTAQMELQYEAAQRLRGQQLAAEAQIAEAYARLTSARAALEQIELDIARTTIVAPFDAFVQERVVELGDFVSISDPVARLVDTDPLIVVGEISEREVGALQIGSRGQARTVNGETLEGRIRYLAPVAEETTRTFRVELAVPNANGAQRAGMSAELRLDTTEISAHFLSSALLTLDDSGAVGVKAVDDSNIVRFYPADIVSSTSGGIWIAGLPEELWLISVGQGFVNPGQTVEPVPEGAAEASESRGDARSDAR